MRSPYCIGVWKPSISKAAAWVSEHYLGDNVIQFAPDAQGSIWIMLRVTGDQRDMIIKSDTVKVIG